MQENTLIFTPTKPLEFDKVYAAKVEAGVTSRAGGVGMREAFDWRFTTVPLPKIVSTAPKRRARRTTAHQLPDQVQHAHRSCHRDPQPHHDAASLPYAGLHALLLLQ